MKLAETITVVVARPLTNADGVASVARAWSRLGLLEPMLWVDPLDESGEFRCETIVNGVSTHAVPLGVALSAAPYRRIKLISVRLATSEGAFDVDAMNAELHRCERSIEESLANGVQEFVRLNLIVPVADLVGLPSGLVVREWNTNVFVAPEDRVDPRYADRGVREDIEYFSHSMEALAANGGLWIGLGDPIHELETVQGSQQGVLRVTRAYTRALFGDDVTAVIAEGVVAGLSDLSLVSSWRGIEVDANPRLAVVRSVERFLGENKEVFGYVAPRAAGHQQRVKTSGVGAIIDLSRFVWGRIQGAPDRVFNRVRERVYSKYENLIQAATYGSDSVYVVKVGDREIPKDLPDVEIGDTAMMVLERVGLDAPAGATANHWDDLRRSMLDLIDPEVSGSRQDRMVADVDCVAAKRFRDPMISGGRPTFATIDLQPAYSVTERASDPMAASELRSILDAEITKLEDARRSTERELKDLKKKASTLGTAQKRNGALKKGSDSVDRESGNTATSRKWSWANGLNRKNAQASVPSLNELDQLLNPIVETSEVIISGVETVEEESTQETSALNNEITLAEGLIAELNSKIQVLQSNAAEAARWCSDQRGSAAWRLGEHLEEQSRESFGAFRDSLDAITDQDHQNGKDLDRKAMKRITRSGIGAAIASIGGIVGMILSTVWFFITIPVAIISWIAYSLANMWRLFRELNRLDQQRSAYEEAIDQLPEIAAQIVKLESTYSQFLEWADLISSMIHPDVRPPGQNDVLQLDAIARSASCQFVEVESDRAGRAGAVSRTGRKLFGVGWTDRQYSVELDVAILATATELGLPPASIDSTPFSGVHQGRIRTLMNEGFSDGSAADRWRREALQAVSSEIGPGSIAALFPTIAVDGLAQTSDEFFDVLKPKSTDSLHSHFGIAHWAPAGLASGATNVEQHFVQGPVALTDPVNGADYIALMSRLDISGLLYDSQLKVFLQNKNEESPQEQFDPHGLG